MSINNDAPQPLPLPLKTSAPNVEPNPVIKKRRNQFRNRFRRHLYQWQESKVKRFHEFREINGDPLCFTSFSGVVAPSESNTTTSTTTSPINTALPLSANHYALWMDSNQKSHLICHQCLQPIENNGNDTSTQNVKTMRHPVFLKWIVSHETCPPPATVNNTDNNI